MTNFRLGAALAGVSLTAFLVLRVLTILQNYSQPPNIQVEQTAQWRNGSGNAVLDDGTYLLGVGKADITG